MLTFRMCIVLIIVVAGQPFLAPVQSSQNSTYKFAYASIARDGSGRIVTVDPVSMTTAVKQMQLFPDQTGNVAFDLYDSWVSPSGEWIALNFVPRDTYGTLRLINTRSGAVRDIGKGIT